MESAVHIKGRPGQIPQILQQSEQRKKDGHGGQHDGHDPGHHPVYAENSHVDEPLGEAYGKGGLSQPRLQGEKQVPQHGGRVIGPGDGEPEDPQKQQYHDRRTGEGAGEDPVQTLFPFSVMSVSYTHLQDHEDAGSIM